jgi:hypothetical protein
VVPIGLIRWFIAALETPIGGGRVRWSMTMTPQAKMYLTRYLTGPAGAAMGRATVRTRPFSVKAIGTVITPSTERAATIQRLASELAWEVVRWCEFTGLITGNLARWAVGTENALLDLVQHGVGAEAIEQVESIDLVALQESLRPEGPPSATIDVVGMTWHRLSRRALSPEAYNDAAKRSYELLADWLTPAERQEAAESSKVTVTNRLGKWIVPLGYGKVTRFVNGHIEAQYCLVPEDDSIPLGDEVLTKVLLLKGDPEAFLAKANRFAP